MAVQPIIEMPDPRLREVSAPVTQFDSALEQLATDLCDTLAQFGGIGLCAPQIGTLQRVLLVHVPDDAYGQQLYINPQIIRKSTPGFIQESCLSVPGVEGNVFRATRLRLHSQNLAGETLETDVDGIHAVCVQHEIDHLDGVLFIDRLSWLKKLRMRLAAARA